MKLILLQNNFSICQVNSLSDVDLTQQPLFIALTEDELSIVCDTDNLPANILKTEDGWKAFKIDGELDFSLVGILSKISTLLADAGISIFAISTYNTDYILIKATSLDKALDVLSSNQYEIMQ